MKFLLKMCLLASILFPMHLYADDTFTDNQSNLHNNFTDICADDINFVKPYEKQYLSIVTENDAYLDPFVDRFYSAGNRIKYTSKEFDYFCENIKYQHDSSYQRSTFWWLSKITFLQNIPNVTKLDLSITQEIYTPDHKAKYPIGTPDYSFAGYAYLSLGVTNRTEKTEETLSLQIGVVGSAALAQYIQDTIHLSFDVGKRINGWDSQLSNEFVANLYYQITTRYQLFNTRYFSSDILHSGNLALGNARIYLGTSGRIRFGYNLDTDFGISKINHSTNSSTPHNDKFSIYIFGGVGGKIVGKNIFISGNTFGPGTNLSLNRFTYELEAGAVMSLYGVRFSYTISYKGREFVNQRDNSYFGSITLDVAF